MAYPNVTPQKVHERMKLIEYIMNDGCMKQLQTQKANILNNSLPKYLVNLENNTSTAILDEKEIALIAEIDKLMQERTNKIVNNYTI
jgi:hypothetical protein